MERLRVAAVSVFSMLLDLISKFVSNHLKYCVPISVRCLLCTTAILCMCVARMCLCACMYFCSPWRCIIFRQPPFFRCHSSSDNQQCSSFSGLSCGPSSSDQGPSSAEDNPTNCTRTGETSTQQQSVCVA